MALHKFGYTEEVLQTRLIQDIQDSYEKLEISSSNIETKINNNTNEIEIYLYNYNLLKMNNKDCFTK